MTGTSLLASLACAALAMASAHSPRRTLIFSLVATAVTAIAASFLPTTLLPAKPIVVLTGVSVIATAALIYFPRLLSAVPLVLVSINIGVWTGAILAGPGARTGLVFALPWLLLSLPAQWIVQRRWQISLKVAASWLIAIALLSVSLNTISMPSYELDHME